MGGFFIDHPHFLALFALILFVGLAGMVVLYIATDRRSAHHRRMEGMALDDERNDQGAPHV